MLQLNILLRILIIVALVELAIMIGLNAVGRTTSVEAALLDSLVLTVICAPLLYFFVVRMLAKELTRRELKLERDLAAAVVDDTTALVMVTDGSGTIVRFNRGCEELTGYSAHEAVGKAVWEFMVVPEEAERAKAAFADLRTGWVPNRYECYWRGKGNDRYLIEWSNTVVSEGEGRSEFVISTGTDVTEQRRIERELLMFELGIERSGDVVFLTDVDGRIVYVNPSFERTYGFTREESLGKTPRILKSGVLPPEAYQNFWNTLLAKEVTSGEIVNKTKDGGLVTVEGSANPVLDEDGVIIGFLAIQRDVTDKKETQRALVASEKRFRTLMEKIPDGLGVLSQHGRILYANHAVSSLLGYSLEELQGKLVSELQHPDDRERAKRRTQELFRDSAEFPSEYRLIHRDGTAIPVELSSRVIEYDGEPALLATMRDLTERRQLEDQLRQSQKMEAVGQLAGGIAHDFNNLLTVIQTSSELIADSLPARVPELLTDVEEVRAAVKRGKSLIEQLLAFSRRGELRFESVDVGRLTRDFKPTLQRLLPEDVDIRMDVSDEPCATYGNPGSLEQIIMNLATNASHAMPSGGVLSVGVDPVRLTMEDSVDHMAVSAGKFICLSVSDTGVGMDEWTRDKLFEPFFTTRSMGGGTGLGTAVVYGLVKQHGGTVRVESDVGKGTRVEVYLPVATEDAAGTAAEVPQEPGPERYGGSETILVAEDEPALRRAAKRSLERLGYRVLLAADGEEAVQLYRNSADPVHLVMTDMVMPRMGGRALYETLRQGDGDVKFLFASGYTAGDMQEKDLMEPDFPFLAKPWTIEELAQKIREVLDKD